MSLTPRETWARLLDRARQELPEQTFKTWLEPTEALTLEGETLLVGCPDQFAADWNADLIVVGSSRMGDIGSLFLGSVSHDLLHVTDRPVLIAERVS